MRLSGKTAVITGGTRGLGRAIAERYLREGARVVCAARNPYDIKEVIDLDPDRCAYLPVDVTSDQSVDALMAETVDTFGGVDILVANAGVSRDGRVDRLALDDWRDMVSTNLTGVFLCTRAAVPYLERSDAGRIVTVSSSMATRVAVGAAGYCATKAAVEMFTRVSAIELAPRGILVNALAPGILDEGMGQQVTANDRIWSKYRTRLSLGRPGTGEEAADAAVFLAGPEASYVNGHVLEVNGGLLWS
ncbi:3-oxoacyl-ACP reductase FabG [Paractinoplanes ferrugineus]|uniref:3-oxoacyl-[acyl-carrier-protein] reductase FabG n=1 Tax=Paractinoplanes ferrugineus TaxID=113564 RepID=A0A919J366_9ACTN|nr:SDR family NAD(P)-dependent oxidoreductase [Actinoplanes ferrugineus]GIE13100.1 3-oxoacyl-[acyl-carrier-protein] reductase FabG [Actinoplanes ferrugineus]